ncbi:short chain dehydrogenase [Prauserella marina]|uniref:Short chain dehydrogenase n=1 Tax=Prauserella marina TaxID=530584 RepID=A0A1G6UGW1_9PSEU|nr:short subunit dehydrogenase [Prauserella marina]SDD39785.1 short chain dehydrogenase [Prauserella marina]
MDIAGAAALVTGGASGLGLATVRELHRMGASVAIVDLPSSDGADIAAELGERAVFAPADVTSEDAVSGALDAAQRLGNLRVAVNCAGISTANKTVGKNGAFPLADFTRVVTVNLIGTFNVIRLAAERMSALQPLGEERGVIVNTASVAAFEGQIAGGLLGLEGRHRRHDVVDRARPRGSADQGGDHRARSVQHSPFRHAARGGRRLARSAGPAPFAAR